MYPAPFFDRLCQVADRHLPEIAGYVRQARLFVFDKEAREFLPRQYSQEEAKFMTESFFLPFQVTAVEDKTSVIILFDQEPDTVGYRHRRGFIELIDHKLSAGFRDQADSQRLEKLRGAGVSVVVLGFMEVIPRTDTEVSNEFDVGGDIVKMWGLTENEILDCPIERHDPQWASMLFMALANPTTAMQELWYANTPNQFIVEVIPKKVRDPEKSPKAPRSHERPQYVLLKPDEIRKRFIPRGPAGLVATKKAPHERRRHWRTLRSDRFVNKQGSTILIPATWVGPAEAQVGNRTYRVRLDL